MPVRVRALTVEYLVTPLGLDVRLPRFGWQLESDDRDVVQRAYQVVVASNPDALDAPDMWDSGRQASDQCVGVPYLGAPLASRQRYYWKVRVWTDAPSESEASWFEMGLLDPSDWTARWIS